MNHTSVNWYESISNGKKKEEFRFFKTQSIVWIFVVYVSGEGFL